MDPERGGGVTVGRLDPPDGGPPNEGLFVQFRVGLMFLHTA